MLCFDFSLTLWNNLKGIEQVGGERPLILTLFCKSGGEFGLYQQISWKKENVKKMVDSDFHYKRKAYWTK